MILVVLLTEDHRRAEDIRSRLEEEEGFEVVALESLPGRERMPVMCVHLAIRCFAQSLCKSAGRGTQSPGASDSNLEPVLARWPGSLSPSRCPGARP